VSDPGVSDPGVSDPGLSDPGDTRLRVERLRGEIDIASVPALARRLTSVPNTLHTLIVDLSAVTYLDSSGVRLLHELHDRLSLRAQRLVVVCPEGAAPRRVLDLTGFGHRVALEDSLAQARTVLDGG
jgi:stage II sporulation protein AA (anti-sigma F factor antagonist)